MFPYLKNKKDFLNDCETIKYKIRFLNENNNDQNGFYQIVNRDGGREGFYCNTRGCNKNRRKCEKCPQSENCIYRRCPLYDRNHDYGGCKECRNISEIVKWLVHNVDNSYATENKHALGDSNIGNIHFSELHAWCQSVGVFMRDVVMNIKADNILIGLEYCLDNRLNDHVRVDFMIAGYDVEKVKKIILVELKQYDKEYIDNNNIELDDIANQIIDYYYSIKNQNDEITVLPCVLMHNYQEGIREFVNVNSDIGVPFFYSIDKLSDYINENIDDSCNESTKDIITSLLNSRQLFTSRNMAEIMFGKEQLSGFDLPADKSIVKLLRRDQEYVYDAITKQLEHGNQGQEHFVNIVRGASGCGKTVLVAMLIRYCICTQKRVAFIYHGTAPRNAIFKTELKTILLAEIEKYFERNYSLSKNVSDWFCFVDIIHYANLECDNYDLILFDEFHRYQKAISNNSISFDELIARGKCFVALIDELQEMNFYDNGAGTLNDYINAHNKVNEFSLWSQFRCNFQEGFVTWVEQILQIQAYDTYIRKTVDVDTSLEQVYLDDIFFEASILNVNDNDTICNAITNSDILLTDCDEGRKVVDEVLGIFENDSVKEAINNRIGDGEEAKKYICKWNDVQGLEFQTILVIIDGRIKFDTGTKRVYVESEGTIPEVFKNKIREKYSLTSGRNLSSWDNAKNVINECTMAQGEQERTVDDIKKEFHYNEELTRILKNRYRMLLTRGMKKCYIYVIDADFRDYMNSRIQRNECQL